MPEGILHHQECEFVNDLLKQLSELCGIKKLWIMPTD